jgi:hypothetical protein
MLRYEEVRNQLDTLREEVRQLRACNQQGKVTNSSGGCIFPRASLETKWVTFNGVTLEIYGQYGVSEVSATANGRAYVVVWSQPFSNSNYAITGSSNMLGRSGVMFDVEGNNIEGNTFRGVNPGSCVVAVRNPRNNANSDSDYISVVAIGYAD